MLGLLVWGFWLALTAYLLWLLFRANTFQPLSLDDLALTWKLHKKQTGCKTSRIHTLLVRNNEVVGFKCECGYEYLQKRLITQNAHTFTRTKLTPSLTNKFTGVLEIKRSVETAGLNCSHIKQL